MLEHEGSFIGGDEWDVQLTSSKHAITLESRAVVTPRAFVNEIKVRTCPLPPDHSRGSDLARCCRSTWQRMADGLWREQVEHLPGRPSSACSPLCLLCGSVAVCAPSLIPR